MTAWLTIVLAAASGSAPQDVQTDFRAANDRALAGEHVQALALYRSILERGFDDGDVHYNLGHVLEDASRPVEAIVAYERALLRNPSDEDAQANLERLRSREVRGAPEADPAVASIADALGPWLRGTPIGPIGWVSAVAILVACIARILPKPQVLASNLLLGFGLLGSSSVGLRALVETSESRAVVLQEAVILEGPDPRFGPQGRTAAGEAVRIIDRQGRFREIQRMDGTTGWVETGVLEAISYP